MRAELYGAQIGHITVEAECRDCRGTGLALITTGRFSVAVTVCDCVTISTVTSKGATATCNSAGVPMASENMASESVKRYAIGTGRDDPDGSVVRYSDYVLMEQRARAAEKALGIRL